MSLTLGPDLRGSLQRILGANADEAVVAMAAHFDALSVLESPNGTETSWMLPGISGATEWPLQERTVLTFLAAMAGLPSMGIAIQTFGHQVYEDPYIHVGECLDLVPPTPADRQFVADLVASGVDLPDTAAGHCIVFAST